MNAIKSPVVKALDPVVILLVIQKMAMEETMEKTRPTTAIPLLTLAERIPRLLYATKMRDQAINARFSVADTRNLEILAIN
jgi:hypothetical protein